MTRIAREAGKSVELMTLPEPPGTRFSQADCDRIDCTFLDSGIRSNGKFHAAFSDAMTASILEEDPDALVAPYLMSGGTDAKHFTQLGLRAFGFAPLRLPEELDFTALFHGVDERVPVDALEFGARVFDRFLGRI